MNEIEFAVRRLLEEAARDVEVRPSFADVERRSRRRAIRLKALPVALLLGVGAIFVAQSAANQDEPAILSTGEAGSPTPGDGNGASVSTTNTISEQEMIHIDVDPVERAGGRSNLLLGTLRADLDRGCLFLVDESGQRIHLVFPHGSRVIGDPLRVVDADGDVFATVDEPVGFGGSITDPDSVEPSDATCGAATSIYVWKT